jgi:ACS family sodium-dependent inorganic phosphate cotransporter-like MFS transporter 5
MFLGSVGTFLSPIAAKLHYNVLIGVRFLTGLVHGVMWPTVATIWSHWAVPAERSRLLSIGNAGSQIGNVVALPLGGYLCVNGFAGGWPSIFYVFGMILILNINHYKKILFEVLLSI